MESVPQIVLPPEMDLPLKSDAKSNNRKSKAPWQLAQPHRAKHQANPYANAGTSTAAPYTESVAATAAPPAGNSLAVPGSAALKIRKNNRRLSIHALATAAHGPHFDAAGLPPLPSNALVYRTATNNSDVALMRAYPPRNQREDDVVDMIRTELRTKDATAIADFHQSLVGQRARVEKRVQDKIDENQKNILQLTDNLQVTQQQLLLLRVLTKELYGIIRELTDAAERRLELELAEPDAARDGLVGPRQTKGQNRDRSSLQLLYKHVDGAQKFVQEMPGRHILGESGRWHGINVGTWKPSEPIHLFLLNDSVLVATRKKTQDSSSKRLQAAHFWPLAAVEITQITPPKKQVTDDSQGYVINLRSNSLSYVYQTDRYDHFMRVMNAYQRGKAEVSKKQRLMEEQDGRPRNTQDAGHRRNASSNSIMDECTDKRQLRDSLRTSGLTEKGTPHARDSNSAHRSNSHRNSADIILKDLSARVHSRNRSHDFMKQEKTSADVKNPAQLFIELKTNEDKLDEVDVHLAHNEYMSAVGLIKHIDARLTSVFDRIQSAKPDDNQAEELRLLVDVVKLKISNRKMKVQEGLLFDLTHTIATLTVEQIANIIEFYLSFGKLEEGLNAILDALSSQLSGIVGRLTSNAHGSTRVDIVNYLSNLIIVHVLIIKRAVNIHRFCIIPILKRESSKTVDSSGFVTWSISEMELLVELIKKHASGSLLVEDVDVWKIKDVKYYDELLKVMESQLKLLKSEGLNVDYLFDEIIHCSAVGA
ncbi:hypothetical protein METBIDRAFT_87437 [Metschnikowia bicuspidata var. bicuspidata NRRL YB-4993]|uniref:Exocyst complex component EXO84 n=1 Tax=Metschnikowia bicuspidata var. bicuspidata NRRL YB-4993 TaxID=869754 RepID=A0A1A0HBJ4_9ASCO|nr:hypothetical protein METBIDRAFT_87437 [Metschnikowia bicuspidata var. bicuspidata NRRL YB-4993]OBA21247.1 hypothetical protein METBIDRAFT_87437 [Metschnikowia bicuspidata var. bicuspidata NRRL YB-4993]